MKTASIDGAQQLRKLAQFLQDHPRFSPLFSDDAILCGFQVGECFLTIEEMLYIVHAPAQTPESVLAGTYAEWAGGI